MLLSQRYRDRFKVRANRPSRRLVKRRRRTFQTSVVPKE
jgi:hypothetical protein